MSNKLRVIYVDDEKINLELFELIFEDEFEITAYDNPINVLLDVQEGLGFDVLVTDLKMPELDGLKLIESLHEKYPNKKYYIISGFDIMDNAKKAIEAGMVEYYFQKPLDEELIIKIINKK